MKLGKLRRNPATRNGQEGYLLIVIMIMVAVMAILSLAHVENIVTQLKHDQEEELVHRGAQYARAIKKFQKKMGTNPVSVEQLEKTNNMRFLRKRYKDPVTGGDFRLVRATDLAAVLGMGQKSGDNSSADSKGGPSGGSGMNGGVANTILTTVGLGGGATGGPTGNPQSIGTPIGGSGPTFGGGPIIGVTSTSPKKSLKEFNGKNHYKDWYFVYLPQFDQCGGAAGVAAVPGVQTQVLGGLNAQAAIAGAARPMTCPLIKGPFVPTQGNRFGGGGIQGAVDPSKMTWGSSGGGSKP